ncbi:MAG: hypothetical protein WC346_00225 [Methanogenium sp.]|jgi:hypothetical protein
MKVELLVNLKLGNGRIIPAGSVYSDENGPIPEFIFRRLKRGMAKVLDSTVRPSRSSKTETESASKPAVASTKETKSSSKKILKKSA